MAIKKQGLGRGLDELFDQNKNDEGGVVTLNINDIEPNRDQPRRDFDDESLSELSDSISKHGIIQPLMVRPLFSGVYQIVAGERRWRAARIAGLSEVPVVIRDLTDIETMEIALIENLQREDLSPIEEALGYQTLIDQYKMTQEDVAKTVGKSRPVVSNSLRLLNLPEEVLEMVKSGELSGAQGRTLLSFKDTQDMIDMACRTVKEKLTVRELEKLSKKINKAKKDGVEGQDSSEKETVDITLEDKFFREVEASMTEMLSRKVKVKTTSNGQGLLEIQFYNEEDLKDILQYFD